MSRRRNRSCLPGLVSPGELAGIVHAESARGEAKESDGDPPSSVVPIPELALLFIGEAMPLAVGLGDLIKEIALSLFITRVFREMGKQEEAVRSREELGSSLEWVIPAKSRCLTGFVMKWARSSRIKRCLSGLGVCLTHCGWRDRYRGRLYFRTPAEGIHLRMFSCLLQLAGKNDYDSARRIKLPGH